ncbi:MAG: hypothetical protein V4487_08525 [Chlamydiota bacterium]
MSTAPTMTITSNIGIAPTITSNIAGLKSIYYSDLPRINKFFHPQKEMSSLKISFVFETTKQAAAASNKIYKETGPRNWMNITEVFASPLPLSIKENRVVTYRPSVPPFYDPQNIAKFACYLAEYMPPAPEFREISFIKMDVK